MSVNTWHHLCGVFASAIDRRMYLDGDTANKGSDTISRTPLGGYDRVAIGTIGDFSPGDYMSGRGADAAIWNIALSEPELVVLSKGYSPLFVHPENLVFYAPLINNEDRDIIGGRLLSEVSTPTVADHAPIRYPTAQILQFPSVSAGVTTLPGFHGANRGIMRGVGRGVG